jgi:hypothetical protein
MTHTLDTLKCNSWLKVTRLKVLRVVIVTLLHANIRQPIFITPARVLGIAKVVRGKFMIKIQTQVYFQRCAKYTITSTSCRLTGQ